MIGKEEIKEIEKKVKELNDKYGLQKTYPPIEFTSAS